jgi:hypothetical protein
MLPSERLSCSPSTRYAAGVADQIRVTPGDLDVAASRFAVAGGQLLAAGRALARAELGPTGSPDLDAQIAAVTGDCGEAAGGYGVDCLGQTAALRAAALEYRWMDRLP